MCKYRVIMKMRKDGTLKAAVNAGLVSPNVLRHEEIYEYYLKIKSSYKSKMMAITAVSEDKKACERLVWKVIKDFGC